MTTHEKCINYNFVAPFSKTNFHSNWEKISHLFIWEKKQIFLSELASSHLKPQMTKKHLRKISAISGNDGYTQPHPTKNVSLAFILSLSNTCKKFDNNHRFLSEIMIKKSWNLIFQDEFGDMTWVFMHKIN